ncbi:MAG TPA: FIST N-terminal domain-containing protein [Tahibacter sp.]|nr:FIST N-terminal domain-containing protein [Tahibacter sp.]
MSDHTAFASSRAADPATAVAELAAQFAAHAPDLILFFCSPRYDLDALARALDATFACTLAGCTSAGQIGPHGFAGDGICAIALLGGTVRATAHLVQPLSECHLQAVHIAGRVRRQAELGEKHVRRFGLLFCDGLSMCEERLAAALYQALGAVPVVGGSAGDDMAYVRTGVYHGGRFLSDAAVFLACDTTMPFVAFKLQHFVPTATKLVVTETSVGDRTIRELNGMPAAEAYAEAVGVDRDALDAHLFARRPMLLRFGDDYHVRAIKKVNADASFTCFGAVEIGTVVTLGEAIDPVATVEQAFAGIHADIGEPQAILAFDSVLRRLEFEAAGVVGRINALFDAHRVLGFSTYGEQFNGQHVNQTLCGLALGQPA